MIYDNNSSTSLAIFNALSALIYLRSTCIIHKKSIIEKVYYIFASTMLHKQCFAWVILICKKCQYVDQILYFILIEASKLYLMCYMKTENCFHVLQDQLTLIDEVLLQFFYKINHENLNFFPFQRTQYTFLSSRRFSRNP